MSVYYTTFSYSAIPNTNYSAWIARVFLRTTKMSFLIPVVQSLVREFYTPQIFNAPILIRMFGSLDFDKYKSFYMANPVLGKSLCSDWFFLGQEFAVQTISMEM